MPRLPVPGSDNGTWGNLLNDYLSQAHDTNGALKAGSVPTGAIQDGAVTFPKIGATNAATAGRSLTYNGTGLTWADPSVGGSLTGTVSSAQIANAAVGTAQIANGSITTDKLAPGVGHSTNTGLKTLLVFYSAPNIMNGRFDDNYAAGVYARYDDVIIPGELRNPADQYHASTKTILQKARDLDTGTFFWGYVDFGMTNGASNLSIGTIQSQIDDWITFGVDGIFCDLVGYDYGVSRARQNTLINYIHGKGMPAFLNVWNSDDLLGSAVNATYNPTGTATAANSTDAMMLESWIINTDAYSSPSFASMSQIKERGDKAVAYRTSMGIRLYAINIFSFNGKTTSTIKQMYDYTNAFARIWRLDGSGMGGSNYSSSGVDLGVFKHMYSDLRSTPLRPTAPYSLGNFWKQADATDLGITVIYDPDTATYTWSQD